MGWRVGRAGSDDGGWSDGRERGRPTTGSPQERTRRRGDSDVWWRVLSQGRPSFGGTNGGRSATRPSQKENHANTHTTHSSPHHGPTHRRLASARRLLSLVRASSIVWWWWLFFPLSPTTFKWLTAAPFSPPRFASPAGTAGRGGRPPADSDRATHHRTSAHRHTRDRRTDGHSNADHTRRPHRGVQFRTRLPSAQQQRRCDRPATPAMAQYQHIHEYYDIDEILASAEVRSSDSRTRGDSVEVWSKCSHS